jgi:hypothetical protein
MSTSARPWAQHVASRASSSRAPAAANATVPARRIAHSEEFGPFAVMRMDDGTTSAYGAPPRGRFWQWAAGPDPLSLDLVRVLVVAIDAAPDAARLARWARSLTHCDATDPAAPDLLA